MTSSRHLAFRPRSPLFLPTNVQPPWYCELQKAFESSSRSRRLGQPPVDYSSMLTVAVKLWHVAVNLARGGLYKRCVSFVFTPHSSLSIPPHCELPPSFSLLRFTDGPYILRLPVLSSSVRRIIGSVYASFTFFCLLFLTHRFSPSPLARSPILCPRPFVRVKVIVALFSLPIIVSFSLSFCLTIAATANCPRGRA